MGNAIVAPWWMLAEKKNYYIEDATDTGTGNDKFDSDVLQEYEVPTGKRWIFLGMQVTRDANATLWVRAYDSSDQLISALSYSAAATGTISVPSMASGDSVLQTAFPLILDAGEYIALDFGAAQGAGASASCIVLEIDV